MFRRRCLCLVQEMYRLQRGKDRRAVVASTAALGAELFVLASFAAFAPLLYTNLRAKPAALLVCTDASDCLGAAVATLVGPALTKELLRHTLAKGHWGQNC